MKWIFSVQANIADLADKLHGAVLTLVPQLSAVARRQAMRAVVYLVIAQTLEV